MNLAAVVFTIIMVLALAYLGLCFAFLIVGDKCDPLG